MRTFTDVRLSFFPLSTTNCNPHSRLLHSSPPSIFLHGMNLHRLWRAFVAAALNRSSSPQLEIKVSPSPARLVRNVIVPSAAHARPRALTLSCVSFDLVLEILSWCGPTDLLALRDVCTTFRLLLANNPSIWRLARAPLKLDFPLPFAAPSEEWFVRYVLASGLCTVCRRSTTELPYSFALDIRICSAACSFYLLRVEPADIDEYLGQDRAVLAETPNTSDKLETLMLKATPYLEGTASSPLYRPSTIHARLEELRAATDAGTLPDLILDWMQTAAAIPFFMEMSETVQKSAPQYRSRKMEVEKRNRALLTALARENDVTYGQLTTSPTLIRHANAFAKDLTCMTRQAWATIQETCLKEIEWLRTPRSRILCSLCQGRKQKYAWDGLQEHIRTVHPESYLAVAPDVHVCTLCPHATRYKHLEEIKRHIKTMHMATRADL